MATLAKLPSITITASDHERLERIASAFDGRSSDMDLTLADELDRARIVDPARVAPGVVTMHSRVEFYFDRDEADRRTVTLVYPGEQDIAEGKISVHTPVGIALLGLSEGQSIEWAARTGKLKRLTVSRVIHQPGAARHEDGANAAAPAEQEAPAGH
jgi:regulator of nucleoside diphosphate kinase